MVCFSSYKEMKSNVYLDSLKNYAFPQLEGLSSYKKRTLKLR